MSDLISKSALLENAWEVSYKDEWHMTKTEKVVSVTDIEEAPSIDAIPVVRCRECRWKEDEQPGMVYCPAVVGGWVDEDWFCKGGERREDDNRF